VGEDTNRAPRYAIRVPLLYRAVGQADWIEGTTENISRTGVLFRGAASLAVDTPVELDLRLSVGVPPGAGSDVICEGRVVRTVLPGGDIELPAIAATIADYRFARAMGAAG